MMEKIKEMWYNAAMFVAMIFTGLWCAIMIAAVVLFVFLPVTVFRKVRGWLSE